ncbi:MAG: maltose ABC transporter permease [Alphaproteobacteria bacterium]|nr:maltose ABC transporter permease [Alphaproteobacteria bacterium]
MEAIKDFFGYLFGSAVGLALMGSMSLGMAYWVWMAIQLGSFLMFAALFFPPTMIIAAPTGLYSFIFGAPEWVINMFG